VNVLEIPLRRRAGKLSLYIFFVLLLVLVLLLVGPGAFNGPFDWHKPAGLLVFVFALAYIAGSVYNGIRISRPLLVVAVSQGKLEMYIRHSKGIANRSREIELETVARFYAVRTRSRFLFSDISFEYVPKAGYLRQRIDVIPELYDIGKYGISQVLAYVEARAAHIEIGYDGGIFAQLLKKRHG